MKKMMLVILMCCIAFGCGKPVTGVKVDGRGKDGENKDKKVVVQAQEQGTWIWKTIAGGVVVGGICLLTFLGRKAYSHFFPTDKGASDKKEPGTGGETTPSGETTPGGEATDGSTE
jgi:hypothetical protein